mmetsp:Transcript_56860/g.130817  ORF Transcript_56860/g.130817 Transcript_56860/m.130817 type:complete len:263 (-) Transcript_56860:1079-1867(-)
MVGNRQWPVLFRLQINRNAPSIPNWLCSQLHALSPVVANLNSQGLQHLPEVENLPVCRFSVREGVGPIHINMGPEVVIASQAGHPRRSRRSGHRGPGLRCPSTSQDVGNDTRRSLAKRYSVRSVDHDEARHGSKCIGFGSEWGRGGLPLDSLALTSLALTSRADARRPLAGLALTDARHPLARPLSTLHRRPLLRRGLLGLHHRRPGLRRGLGLLLLLGAQLLRLGFPGGLRLPGLLGCQGAGGLGLLGFQNGGLASSTSLR